MADFQQKVEEVSPSSFESTRKTSFESHVFRSYVEASKSTGSTSAANKNGSSIASAVVNSDTPISSMEELQTLAPQVYDATVQALMNNTIRQMNRFNERIRKANRQLR